MSPSETIEMLEKEIIKAVEENKGGLDHSTHAYNRGKVVAYAKAIELLKMQIKY
jgi:hypothetical protein